MNLPTVYGYVLMEAYTDGNGETFAEMVNSFTEKGISCFTVYAYSSYFHSEGLLFVSEKVDKETADLLFTAILKKEWGIEEKKGEGT